MALAPRRRRSRLRLGLLILTAFMLMTLDFRGYGPLETAQGAMRDLLHPLASGADTVFSPIGDLWTTTFGYRDLRRENAELRAELETLRGRELRADADQEAYRRLLEAIGIDYISDVERVAASVLRDRVGNFGSDELTIDKGRRDGVAAGMAVVTGAGLVGRVDVVGARQSTVTTVSDPGLVIGVRVLGVGDVGLGHGVPGDSRSFVIDAGLPWPQTDELHSLAEVGSTVVTAASSRFPADVPVGTVTSVEPAQAGLLQLVTVEFAVDVDNLGFVTVLLADERDAPPVGPDPPFSGSAVSGGDPVLGAP